MKKTVDGAIAAQRLGHVFRNMCRMYATRDSVRTDPPGLALFLHDHDLWISEGLLYRNNTGSVGDNYNTGHLPALFHCHILWSAAGQLASARYSFGLLPTRLCESDTLLQSCLRVCQSPKCEHHRAPGARKRCGPCRNHPEPADHIDNSGGRRADIGGCSGGQWGGDDWGSGISDHHASLCALIASMVLSRTARGAGATYSRCIKSQS